MIKKNGFTLVELLIVTLIIAVLTTLAIPQYRKSVQKAYMSEMNTLIVTMRDALSAYGNEFNKYPEDINQLTLPFNVSGDADEALKFTKVYLQKDLTVVDKKGNNAHGKNVKVRAIVLEPRKRTNVDAIFYITMTESGYPVYLACKEKEAEGEDCKLLSNFGCEKPTDSSKIQVCRSLFD